MKFEGKPRRAMEEGKEGWRRNEGESSVGGMGRMLEKDFGESWSVGVLKRKGSKLWKNGGGRRRMWED